MYKLKGMDKLERIYKDSILKNSIYLIITNFSSLIIGFFFWMIVARYYMPEEVGIFSAILSSILLISTISTIGLPMSLVFFLPRYSKNAKGIINSCLIMSIITSVIFSLIFVLGIDILAPKLKYVLWNLELAIIFIITTMMTTLSLLMAGMFIAGNRSSFHMIKENIFGIVRISLIILLSSFGVIGIFLTWSIGLGVAILTGLFLLFKLWKYKPSLSFDPIIKDMAGFSIGNYIAGIFYNLPKFIFPIIIIHMISEDAAGYFFIAMTMASLLFGISESVAGPFMAESSKTEQFWDNVNKVIRFNLSILTPGLLLVLIFGKFVLSLFNPIYAENSFHTLIILAISSIPLSVVIIFNMIKNSQKKVVTVIKVDLIVASTTILLALPFMRIWNIEGIGLAYLIANGIMAVAIIIRLENPADFAIRLVKGTKVI